jgi:predicted acetyltransferase
MLILRPLRQEDEEEARRSQEEFEEASFSFIPPLDEAGSFRECLRRLERERLGQDLAAQRVPATFLVAVVDGQIVGRTYIRHELNERLRRDGGHVGYGVRPRFRRRGYATEILTQSLRALAEMGVDIALVTCDVDNVASRKTIERCGGRLGDIVHADDGEMCRYWIPTDRRLPPVVPGSDLPRSQ